MKENEKRVERGGESMRMMQEIEYTYVGAKEDEQICGNMQMQRLSAKVVT